MCRMPSLYFIYSHLKTTRRSGRDDSKEVARSGAQSGGRGIQQENTFFVLNPSNDLANTQKMFRKWFEK